MHGEYAPLADQAAGGFAERFRIAGHVKSVMKEHLAILEAIERRSVEDAVERLTAHIRNARDRALAV